MNSQIELKIVYKNITPELRKDIISMCQVFYAQHMLKTLAK